MTPRKLIRLTRAALRHGGADIRLARRAIHQHGAVQRTWELASLVGVVRDIRPRTVLEIGTFRGGTLACWAETATPDAHIVCIDRLEDSYGIVKVEAHTAHLRRLIRPAQQLTFLPFDSQDAATVQKVKDVLKGDPVDFLWIDGDHHEGPVRRDFELYGALVAPGGTIGFHDIHPDPELPGNQAYRVWRELKERLSVREFIDQDHPGGAGMGIGVLQVARR
jgi:predicted O-methyltransferase YrrM